MVHGIITLRTAVVNRRPPVQSAPSSAQTSAQQSSTPAPAASSSSADFRSLFSGQVYPGAAATTTQSPAPTAESVFGANPWLNAYGIGPTGAYSYNPYYFATAQTAAKVAAMVGGTVVQTNSFTGGGGVFTQQQPNLMVQLPNGKLINPGLVASFYTHGYPQSYIDQMIVNEINNA